MKITYEDKVSLTSSVLPRANKCTDDDLNEIKEVVNTNDGTILYNSENGTTGNVTLSDSAENYEYIEIFAHRFNQYFSHKILNPNNKNFTLYNGYYENNNIYAYTQPNSISGNTITRGTSALSYCANGGYVHVDIENPSITCIDRVVGYK